MAPGVFVATAVPSWQIESSRIRVVVLHAGSSPTVTPERRRRITRRHVVAERLTGEEQVVGAPVLGVGDEVERLAEHRLADRDLEPADGHLGRARRR